MESLIRGARTLTSAYCSIYSCNVLKNIAKMPHGALSCQHKAKHKLQHALRIIVPFTIVIAVADIFRLTSKYFIENQIKIMIRSKIR